MSDIPKESDLPVLENLVADQLKRMSNEILLKRAISLRKGICLC